MLDANDVGPGDFEVLALGRGRILAVGAEAARKGIFVAFCGMNVKEAKMLNVFRQK